MLLALNLPSPNQIARHEIQHHNKAPAPILEGKKEEQNKKNKNKQPEVIIEKNYDIKNKQLIVPMNIIFGQNIAPKKKQEKTNSQQIEQYAKNSVTYQPQTYKGYCDLGKQYTISIEPIYVDADCIIKNTSPAEHKIRLKLIPVVKKYALVGEVLKVDGHRVQSIKVMSPDRESVNIAQEVNRRVISNILLYAASQTGQQTSQLINQIFSSSTTNNYIGNTNSTVTNNQVSQELHQLPQAALYLGIANTASGIANAIPNKQLPPLFTSYRILYVEYKK